jgi:hypothetical protein
MGWVLDSGSQDGAVAGHFLRARKPRDCGGAVGAGRRGGSALFPVDPKAIIVPGDRKAITEKAFDARENLVRRSCCVYDSAKLAAVPHAMSKPASELLHFAYTVGQVGSTNLSIVVNQ